MRILSQGGDGAFQVGIAAAFFFDPNTGTTPGQIALGLAIMFAPFTLVGPLAGPLIDRWYRQRIVMVGNIVRLALTVIIIAAIGADAPVWLLYTLALTTLSVNRFLLASLTAGLPRVVADQDLLTANAIMPTLGTLAATAGAALGGVAALVIPSADDTQRSMFALVAAAALFGLSSFSASALGKTTLGPAALLATKDVAAQTINLLRELRDGVRHLAGKVTPFHALGVMATSRLMYGLLFITALLVSRHVWSSGESSGESSGDAISGITLVLGFAAAGFGLAAILTPLFADRIDRHHWIVACLIVGAAGQVVLSISPDKWALLSGAVVMSFAVQGVKIAVDTIVQRDTNDAYRGRAFALYDVAYNVAFISSAFIGALVLPLTGYSRPVMITLVFAYLAAALLYSRAPRQARAVKPGKV